MANVSKVNIDSTEYDIKDSGAERVSNKVTTITSLSTDNQYPSAKSVYDIIVTAINTIEGELDNYVPVSSTNSAQTLTGNVSNSNGVVSLSSNSSTDIESSSIVLNDTQYHGVGIYAPRGMTVWQNSTNAFRVDESGNVGMSTTLPNASASILGSSVQVISSGSASINGENLYLNATEVSASEVDSFSVTLSNDASAYINLGGKLTVNNSKVTSSQPASTSNDNEVATTKFVNDKISAYTPPVTSVNGLTGAITGLLTTSNLVTTIDSSSTDTTYPSAKAVNDALANYVPGLVETTGLSTWVSHDGSVLDIGGRSDDYDTVSSLSIENGSDVTLNSVDNLTLSGYSTYLEGYEVSISASSGASNSSQISLSPSQVSIETSGKVTSKQPASTSNDNEVATTKFVNEKISAYTPPVTSVNGQTGAVTGLQTTSNLVTTISSSSTDTTYPSAKAVNDFVDNGFVKSSFTGTSDGSDYTTSITRDLPSSLVLKCSVDDEDAGVVDINDQFVSLSTYYHDSYFGVQTTTDVVEMTASNALSQSSGISVYPTSIGIYSIDSGISIYNDTTTNESNIDITADTVSFSTITSVDNITLGNNTPISAYLQSTSAKTNLIWSGSTNNQYPSALAVYNYVDTAIGQAIAGAY